MLLPQVFTVRNCGGGGGVDIPPGVDIPGWVGIPGTPRDTYPSPVLTPSGSHQNMYSGQAGGTHPTGMLSCCFVNTNKLLLPTNDSSGSSTIIA